MRLFIFTALLIAILAGIGALYFEHEDGRATITVDTQKVERAAETVIEKGREVSEELTEPTRYESNREIQHISLR